MDAQQLRQRNRRMAIGLAAFAAMVLIASTAFWSRLARFL